MHVNQIKITTGGNFAIKADVKVYIGDKLCGSYKPQNDDDERFKLYTFNCDNTIGDYIKIVVENSDGYGYRFSLSNVEVIEKTIEEGGAFYLPNFCYKC